MIIRIKGVNRIRAKGRTYYYHRKSGARLPGSPGSGEFMAALARLGAQSVAMAPPTPAGTFSCLVRAYLASPEFTSLAPRTRKDYRKVLDFLGERMGTVLLEDIDGPAIFAIRDKTLRLRKRRFANYVVQMLRLVFAWAKPRGQAPGLAGNPAIDVPQIRRPKGMPIANRPWSDHEITTVLEAASPALRLPIALGAYLGARQGDVLRLTWTAYDGQGFAFTQGKTAEALWLPAHARLRELLARTPRESPIIVVGVRGRPFTSNGFQREFFKLIGRLEGAGKVAEGLTFHGLRHTVGKWLADAGCDDRDIQAWLGHKTAAMASHYTKQADQKRRVLGVAAKLGRAGRSTAENDSWTRIAKLGETELQN
jgi:integrase